MTLDSMIAGHRRTLMSLLEQLIYDASYDLKSMREHEGYDAPPRPYHGLQSEIELISTRLALLRERKRDDPAGS